MNKSDLLFCIVELTYCHPVCFHKTILQFFSEKLNSSFFKMPAATCTSRSTYLVSRTCILSSLFCGSFIFEILVTYHSCQPSSTLIESCWEAFQFLPDFLLPSPAHQIALSLFLLSTSGTDLYSTTYTPLLSRMTLRHSEAKLLYLHLRS